MDQTTAVNNALGTIVGYLGAEVATDDTFERLLWPQRFYNGFSLTKTPKMALLMPMGGPLHRAALSTFDNILDNGLFRSHLEGHMLGSPFYADTHAEYTAYNCANTDEKENEYVRNGLWIGTIANLPIPYGELRKRRNQEMEAALAKGDRKPAKIKSIHRVSHLKISVPDHIPPSSEIIGYETDATSLKTYCALVVTELSSIGVGTAVMVRYRSLFMLYWFAPLILKILSAIFAVSRDPLEIPEPYISTTRSEKPGTFTTNLERQKGSQPVIKRFEIRNSKAGFLIVEGDEKLILQFFRHYAHPIRDYIREYAQYLIIIAFGCVFPVGLLCSLLWMPPGIQYIWIGYQVYCTFAMHIFRFTGGRNWMTTADRMAEGFAAQAARGQKQRAYLGGKAGVLMADLEITYHDRYGEGKRHMEKLLFEDNVATGGSTDAKISTTSGTTTPTPPILFSPIGTLPTPAPAPSSP